MPSWSAKDDCLGPRRQVLELILEDLVRQAWNQDFVLFGIPSTNRRPNGGEEPHALHSTTRVDKEEHQGVGGVPMIEAKVSRLSMRWWISLWWKSTLTIRLRTCEDVGP